jgi:hypothetical protein
MFGNDNVYFCFCKQRIRVSNSFKKIFVFYFHATALWPACGPGHSAVRLSTAKCLKLQTRVVHSVVCLKTLPKRVLHRMRSNAFSFNFQYPLVSLRSFSSCLRLLTRGAVTSILPQGRVRVSYLVCMKGGMLSCG